MESPPILYREEALTIMGLIGDIVYELRQIKRRLSDDDEEEEENQDD